MFTKIDERILLTNVGTASMSQLLTVDETKSEIFSTSVQPVSEPPTNLKMKRSRTTSSSKCEKDIIDYHSVREEQIHQGEKEIKLLQEEKKILSNELVFDMGCIKQVHTSQTEEVEAHIAKGHNPIKFHHSSYFYNPLNQIERSEAWHFSNKDFHDEMMRKICKALKTHETRARAKEHHIYNAVAKSVEAKEADLSSVVTDYDKLISVSTAQDARLARLDQEICNLYQDIRFMRADHVKNIESLNQAHVAHKQSLVSCLRDESDYNPCTLYQRVYHSEWGDHVARLECYFDTVRDMKYVLIDKCSKALRKHEKLSRILQVKSNRLTESR